MFCELNVDEGILVLVWFYGLNAIEDNLVIIFFYLFIFKIKGWSNLVQWVHNAMNLFERLKIFFF